MGCCESGPSSKYRVLLISGSLRKASTNTGLLRACAQIRNPHLAFEWADISDFPIFNQDIEAQGVPIAVNRVKNQVKRCNAILFGNPQNNYSPSAAMKNAYDWLSRGQNSVLKNIPAAIVSSGGGLGGLRAQKALKDIGKYLNVRFMEGNEIAVKRFTGNYFDDNGNLISAEVRKQIEVFLQAFAQFIHNCLK